MLRSPLLLVALVCIPLALAGAADTGRPAGATKGRPAAQAGKSYSIDSCVNSFNSAKIEKTPAGYQYWFVDRSFVDGRTLKLSVVEPGKATHAPHVHAEDEFFFVVEGQAEFFLDGERKMVGPMTSLYCPSQVAHGIRNVGETVLKYLVIKRYELPEPRQDSGRSSRAPIAR